jgi:hypothetical protein
MYGTAGRTQPQIFRSEKGEAMTPDERERMAILCERIATEQNRDKFARLVDELNDLLDKKESRLAKKTDN